MTNTISPTRKCGTCGKTGLERALVPYRTELKHDGRTYPIEVADMPAIRCPHCEAISLTEASFARLDLALHEAAQLMPASEIIERRKSLRLQKRQLAHALRMAPETITRFERGTRIQSAHYDLMLRLYLASGYVRELVTAFHAGQNIFELARSREQATVGANVAPLAQAQTGAWSFHANPATLMQVEIVGTDSVATNRPQSVPNLQRFTAGVVVDPSGPLYGAAARAPEQRPTAVATPELPIQNANTNSYAMAA